MGEYRDLSNKAAIVSAIGSALPGVGVSGSPVHAPKGFASESWRVTTDVGGLLVKIRRRAADAAKLRSQAEALRLARSGGVPAPELLYAGASEALGGRPLIVLRYISGVDAEEALPGMGAQHRDSLFSDLGEAVGRLHEIGLPKFTDRIGTPEADLDRWSDAVDQRAERVAPRNREIGLLSPSEINAVVHRLKRSAENVSGVVAPALPHHDLYLANVLLRDGRFEALIDFELARGVGPYVRLREAGDVGVRGMASGLRAVRGRVPAPGGSRTRGRREAGDVPCARELCRAGLLGGSGRRATSQNVADHATELAVRILPVVGEAAGSGVAVEDRSEPVHGPVRRTRQLSHGLRTIFMAPSCFF